jgi:hypothetical protein
VPIIYITTYKRANQQITWDNLTPELQKQAVLSVDWEERDFYKGYPVEVLPKGLSRLSPKREFIIRNSPSDATILLDDDLEFYIRKSHDLWNLRGPTEIELGQMFNQIFMCLENGEYAHVGVSGREGNNRVTTDFAENTRYCRLLGYHLPTLRAVMKTPFVDCMEDFDINLQLLQAGFKNCVYYYWAQGQKSSNSPGGCSTYRTMEFQADRARELAAKHPNFVTVVQKKTKTAWGGQERTDVRIAWKKAYESSQS